MTYHLIHISKTGGTALQDVFKGEGRRRDIRAHGHNMTLRAVPPGDTAFFFVRDPVERFVSGFNSRLRKGQPARFHEWRPAERETFARFATPRALAAALASDDRDARNAAEAAMESMIHTRRKQAWWIGDLAEFETLIDRVMFVGHQATMSTDFEVLKTLLGVDPALSLPGSERAHVTPEGFETSLDEAGRAAVAEWYADDYRLYRRCLALREELMAKAAGQSAER